MWVRPNEHLTEPGDLVFRHACKMGLEGIVLKRIGSRDRAGNSLDWIKSKNPATPAVRWGGGRGLGAVNRHPPIIAIRRRGSVHGY